MLQKYILIIAALIGVAAGSSGTLLIAKMVKPKIEVPPCPQCPACPPSTEVKLQDFNAENLRKIKGDFTYSPSLSNVVVKIECSDSVMLKQLLKAAK